MVKNIYALSPLQEGILFHSISRKEDSYPYFEELSFDFFGEFDLSAFERAWNELIWRHDIFKSVFAYKNSPTPKQVVLKERKLKVHYEEIEDLSEIEKYRIENKKNYFNLAKDLLVRVAVFKYRDYYKMVWSFHHIIVDGWCIGIMIDELFTIYFALKNNTSYSLPPAVQYANYIKWLKNQNREVSKEFWREYLKDFNETSHLPIQLKSNSYKQCKLYFELDEELSQKLNHMAKEANVTLNSIFQAIFGIMIAKYNNINDTIFGATVSGRSEEIEGVERIIGLFINAIPIRVKFSDENFKELIQNMMDISIKAKNHHYYSLADIQKETNLNDLIAELLVFDNYPEAKLPSEIQIKNVDSYNETNYNFDITIMPHDKIKVLFKYNSLLFSKEAIETFKNHFLNIANSIELNLKVKELDFITPNDKKVLGLKEELFISSTFTIDNLKDDIERFANEFDLNLSAQIGGYNQVFQDLLTPKNSDFNLLLVRFEDWLRFGESDIDENYNKLVSILKQGFEKPSFIALFPSNDEFKVKYEEFEQQLKDISNLYIIDFREIAKTYNISEVFDSYKDKLGHMPFSDEFYAVMALEVVRKIQTYKYNPFKVIVLDCDNTLWGGIVGEDGVNGIKIDGGYKALQEFLIKKHDEGFLIAINSKNNFNDVMEVFEKLDMPLKKEHIVNFKINWNTKSTNLKVMAKELNLGLNSFIFLDDSKVEISEVMQNTPEVLALNLPSNENEFMPFLEHIWAFDKIKVTSEDKLRTKMYLAEAKREEAQKNYSLDEFLETLNLKLYFDKTKEENIPRVAQLTQRTNQFNLSTIRRSEVEIREIIESDSMECYSVFVEDKFGDYGLVGVIIIDLSDGLFIDTFLLSCRVLGRGVEDGIIYALSQKVDTMRAKFIKSAKNQPFLDFINRSNWLNLGDGFFEIKTPPKPKYLNIIFDTLTKEEVTPIVCTPTNIVSSNEVQNLNEFNWQVETRENLEHLNYYKPLLKPNAKDLLLKEVHEREVKSEYITPSNEIENKLAEIFKEILAISKVGIRDNFFELGGHSLKATQIVARVYKAFKVEINLGEFFENPTIEKLKSLIQKPTDYKEILKAPKSEFYETSFAQRRQFILNQIEKSPLYNVIATFEIKGNLNIDKLEEAFKALIDKYEILRTNFVLIDGEPKQKIKDKIDFKINRFFANSKSEIDSYIDKEVNYIFNLENDTLTRVTLIKENDSYIFILNMHHIISDGWSIGVLLNEVVNVYENEELKKIEFQYKDYAYFQNRHLSGREFWLESLKGELPTLNLPTKPRGKMQTFEGRHLKFNLKVSNPFNTTDFIYLFGLTKVLLYKYTNQSDSILGTVVAGRSRVEFENQIGFFVNTLALRNRVLKDESFKEFINRLNSEISKAFSYSEYPFDKLVDEVVLSRDLSRHPLFDVAVVLQNNELPKSPNGLEVKSYEYKKNFSKFDLSFTFVPNSDGFLVDIEYNTNLFDEWFINQIQNHFIELTKIEIDSKIKDINILNEKEKNRLLTFENKEVKIKNITKTFEDIALKYPNNIALVFENKTLTYRSLNEKVNSLANALKDRVNSNDIVALLLNRSELKVIAMLAILKLNCIYLPIDDNYPKERIKYILKDAKPKLILTNQNYINEFNLENMLDVNKIEGSDNLNPNIEITDYAYMIYTSGSTGIPKGVMIKHSNLNNLLNWYIDEFAIDSENITLLMISFAFDASIKNILAPLLVGGKVVISSAGIYNPKELIELIKTHKVSLINTTPSAFKPIVELANLNELESIEYLALGAEKLNLNLFKKLLDTKTKIYNLYGPTECSDITTCFKVDKYYESVPIGKALPNVKVYLLDSDLNLVPHGVIGEIYIGGVQVGEYLKDNDKFITHSNFGKIYKSGDLAKILKDGNIEFIGRSDEQVKIRGFRVEVSEIESKLKDISKEAFVIAKDDNLIAYVVSEKNEVEIKSYLTKYLPNFMLPNIIKLDSFPLTTHGKINKSKLPLLKKEIKFVKPQNEIQEKLLKVLEVMFKREISIDENFFEIGGNSIKAIEFISKVEKELNINIPLTLLYENPTILTLSNSLKKSSFLTLLTKPNLKPIFVLPIIMGDSTAYKNFLGSEFSFYGFEYEEDFEKYYQEIIKITKEKIILLGYSIGGNFAFELAKYLEAKGLIVSDIILIDSYKREIDINLTQSEEDELIELYSRYFRVEASSEIKERMKKYLRKYNKQTKGKVNSIIHLIKSEKVKETNEVSQKWQENCSELKVYSGFGEHLEMLAIKDNYEIVKEILKLLRGKYGI